MVTRIMKSRGSTRCVVKYNEDKVAAFKAELVHANLMREDSIADIYETLERMENNPLRRNNTSSVAFHMTVNPGPEDECGEMDVLMYITDVMTALGFEKQPYAVYRHEDIDRPHYHVVSVRVKPDGTTVDNHYEGRRVNALQKELAPRYGFHVGVNKDMTRNLKVPEKITYGEEMWPAKAIRKIQMATDWSFHNFEQFQDILHDANIHVDKARFGGEEYDNIVFYVTDDEGKQASTMLSAENDFGEELFHRMELSMGSNVAEGYEAGEELKAACTKAAELCDSLRMLEAVLRAAGYGSAVRRRKNGELRSFHVIDRSARAVFDGSDIIPALSVRRLSSLGEGLVNAERMDFAVTKVKEAMAAAAELKKHAPEKEQKEHKEHKEQKNYIHRR